METFGRIIATARKELGISQKDLAAMIRKEDGGTISPQYLNDIEHDRRNPPSEFIIEQLAKRLNRSKEYLIIAAGMLPSEARRDLTGATPDHVARAYRAFRDSLKKK
jgi:transcriptional regulator with XRE-family HTH domain